MIVSEDENSTDQASQDQLVYYRLQFRDGGQQFTGAGPFAGLIPGTVVMVQTDHGPEPARIAGYSPLCGCREVKSQVSFQIERLAQGAEQGKIVELAESETVAFKSCSQLIAKHSLDMHLVRVERYFSGSKMIFYFKPPTAGSIFGPW